MSAPRVLKPSEGDRIPHVDQVKFYMDVLYDSLGSPYSYGWDTPTSLPIRDDSYNYVYCQFCDALNDANKSWIPMPECWIDSAGVPTLRFATKSRAVHYSFPTFQVMRWARTVQDEDTLLEGVEKNLSHDDMVQIINNDFDWLYTRTQHERDLRKADKERPYK